MTEQVNRVNRLAELRASGALTEEEFQGAKSALAGGQAEASPYASSSVDAKAASSAAHVQRGGFFAVASEHLRRALVKLAEDQIRGNSYVGFFALANKRIAQARKWRMWCGIVSVLFLSMAILGGKTTVSDTLATISVAAIAATLCYLAHRWKGVWLVFQLGVGDRIQKDPSLRKAYEADKAAYKEAVQAHGDDHQEVQRPSKAMTVAAFGAGAVAGHQAMKARQENQQTDRNRKKARHLNSRAQTLTSLLKDTKNPEYRRKWEAELRQIEIEMESLRV